MLCTYYGGTSREIALSHCRSHWRGQKLEIWEDRYRYIFFENKNKVLNSSPKNNYRLAWSQHCVEFENELGLDSAANMSTRTLQIMNGIYQSINMQNSWKQYGMDLVR